MTDRPLGTPQSDAAASDDPTRDVRLPPLSARPAAHTPSGSEATVQLPPPESPEGAASPTPPVAPADPTVVLNQRTDELPPPAEPLRHQTRPFGAPGEPALHASLAASTGRRAAEPGSGGAPAAEPPRRRGGGAWMWVLLVLLPILVIAAAGLLLSLVLGRG